MDADGSKRLIELVGSADKTLRLYEGAYHDEVTNALPEGVAGTDKYTAIAQRDLVEKVIAYVFSIFFLTVHLPFGYFGKR